MPLTGDGFQHDLVLGCHDGAEQLLDLVELLVFERRMTIAGLLESAEAHLLENG